MKILYVNGCINHQTSRTNKLAKAVIDKQLLNNKDIVVDELILEEINISFLSSIDIKKRNRLCLEHQYNDQMFKWAKQFVEANLIVIATPYWDMSFPTILKAYIENICVVGITFNYDVQGIPTGLCNANKLIYITTSGGLIGKYNLGYEYVKGLCDVYWGIKDTQFISCEGLDIDGNDANAMISEAISKL